MQPADRDQNSILRGATRIGFDAFAGLVTVVEHMHGTIQQRPSPVGAISAPSAGGVAGLVYRTIRGSVRLAGRGIDASLALLPPLPDEENSARRNAVLAALNGVYGDYLSRTNNPLAIQMSLRCEGKRLDISDPSGSLMEITGGAPTDRLALLVHGLCMNDQQWNRNGHDHGAVLARETGRTALYLRYNSGKHIAENGEELAEMLETLVARWPVPLREISIIGHSMGGLVARGACHFAQRIGHVWPEKLRKLVFLGTPHLGAPLERGGHWLDRLLELSPYSAPLTRLGKARSAGIQDLRHGAITLEPREFVQLPKDVECYAVAGSLREPHGIISERLLGDGLVPLNSALGRAADGSPTLDLPAENQWIGEGIGHLDLLCRPEVYDCLRVWFERPTVIDRANLSH